LARSAAFCYSDGQALTSVPQTLIERVVAPVMATVASASTTTALDSSDNLYVADT
jgi:hypothetical protein